MKKKKKSPDKSKWVESSGRNSMRFASNTKCVHAKKSRSGHL